MPRPTILAARVALIAVLAAAVGACGSKSTGHASPPGSTRADAASATRSVVPAGTVLNIGDQAQLLQTLFRISGVETGLPYKLNFIEFGSGPLVDAGFAANRIDVGFMGDLPAALSVRSGVPVKAIGVERAAGASLALVARPGVTSISQLRGKKVAYTTGTAQQAIALRALASAGLKQQDVQQVNVTLQQLYAVLESGQVEASVIGAEQERFYLQQHPDAKVLASSTDVTPPVYLYQLASTTALADPGKRAAIEDFIVRLIRAADWGSANPSEYATDYLVDVQHETSAEARLSVSGLIDHFEPITPSVQSALQQVVELEASAGAIASSFSVSPLFDPETSAAYNRILEEVPHGS